jgi:hypothetical protein
MKKYFHILLTAVTLCGFSAAPSWAQQYHEPFLSDETRPNGLLWLPEPPNLTSAEFTYDFYDYQMGRKLREVNGMGEQALSYELVPNDIQQELIKQHEAEMKEED